MQNVILLGTCFGLAIMTKMSALMLGPGIAGLLVYRFVKDKKSRGSKMLQYAGIGVCAGVLGLWYPIKNYLLYGMDLLYIPRLETDSEQFIGHLPVFSATCICREDSTWLGYVRKMDESDRIRPFFC